MALSTAALNIAADALGAAIDRARLHTGSPGGSGTSNVATSNVATISWGAASNGDITLAGTPIAFTGGAAGGPCTHVSFWDGVPGSGGVFMGDFALTGDQTFNAAGEYDLDTAVIDFD